jgi:hypothetical protein
VNRRMMMQLAGAAMAVSMLAAIGTAGAQEVTSSPTISTTPDPTWMTNGVVYSIIRSGDYIYVGGKFTKARSAVTGGKGYAVTNLARFHADTGVGDPTWTPDVTGADASSTRVYALAAAGGKIWVGGKFDAVDGLPRRNLAAVSAATGEVDPMVDPLVGSETNKGVQALLASETKIYLGGYFTKIDGKGRQYLGALDLSGNLDPIWKPKTNGMVHSLAYSCDKTAVFAGGKFRSAAGSDGALPGTPRETLARFGASDGSLHPWAIPVGIVPNEEVAADLAVACADSVDKQISAGYLGRNYVRSFQGDTGTLAWENRAAGDVQAVSMWGNDKLIIGGHFSKVYDVTNPKGITRTRIAQLNLADGSVDTAWNHAIDGTSAQGVMGPWDLLVDENQLYVGGSFTLVDGLQRTQFARFTFAP